MANRSPACQEAHSDPPRAEGTAPPKGTARGKAAWTRRGGTRGRPVGCPGGAPCWPRGAGRRPGGTGRVLLSARSARPRGPPGPDPGLGAAPTTRGFFPSPQKQRPERGSRVGTKRSPLLRSSPPNLQGDNRGCVRPWAPQDPPSLLRSRSLGCSHSQGCPTLPRHPLSPHSVFGVLTIPECGWSRSCCCGVSGAGGPPALPAPPAADVSMRGGRGGEGG